jgi:N-acetylneuraminate synthase
METKVVAEIGINHNGDLKIVKELIDIAADAGCQYVKFQKRTVEDVYTKEELDKYRESPWGTTNREQKNGLEFGKEEFDEIDRYCKEKGIGWFGSPWDVKSVDFLMQYNPKYIKVASAMMTNEPILRRIKERVKGTETKVIAAVGMTTAVELERYLNIVGDDTEYILACTSSYPTPIEDMNMKKIETLKEQYGDCFRIGFSNHSAGIQFIYASVVMGAKMVEFHVTLDRSMYGSDQSASIEPSGVQRVCEYIQDFEIAKGDGKYGCQPSEVPIKEKLRK